MNPKLTPQRPQGVGIVVVAVFSTLIAIGILSGVTDLFQSRGAPLALLAAAERACTGQVYVSDRERCMREWFAASEGARVAHK